MMGTADLILRLFPNAQTAEELANSLAGVRIINKHMIKYPLIYNYYIRMRAQGEKVTGAVMETAIQFNISERQVYKIKKIMESPSTDIFLQ